MTQLLSAVLQIHHSVLLYVHRDRMGLFGTGSPGRPPRLSNSSWALSSVTGYLTAHIAHSERRQDPSLAVQVPLEFIGHRHDGDRHDHAIGWVDKIGHRAQRNDVRRPGEHVAGTHRSGFQSSTLLEQFQFSLSESRLSQLRRHFVENQSRCKIPFSHKMEGNQVSCEMLN